jgi:hypothetical protein
VPHLFRVLTREPIVCTECHRRMLHEDAEAAGWRYFSDGINLHPYCVACAFREFGFEELLSPRPRPSPES